MSPNLLTSSSRTIASYNFTLSFERMLYYLLLSRQNGLSVCVCVFISFFSSINITKALSFFFFFFLFSSFQNAVKKLLFMLWRPVIGILKEHLMYFTVSPRLKHLLILDIWRSFTVDIKASFSFPIVFLNDYHLLKCVHDTCCTLIFLFCHKQDSWLCFCLSSRLQLYCTCECLI